METAHERLKKLSRTHVETTMIGALSVVEETFGHLWNYKNPSKTKEEKEMFALYEQLRKKILDTGNNQKRKLEEEFACFDVKVRVFKYEMRVAPHKFSPEEEEFIKKHYYKGEE